MKSIFDVLYVTSFTPDLYARTGRQLVQSFLRSDSDGKLLVCHEGRFEENLPCAPQKVMSYDLDKSDFLTAWLAANEDIIPVSLGGTAPACQCEEPDNPWGRHRTHCVSQWFNKNASRWFRKIVALDVAAGLAKEGAIVWVDDLAEPP